MSYDEFDVDKTMSAPALADQLTTLNRENKALMSAVKDNEQYQTDIRKGIVDSGLLGDPSKLDGLYLDDVVEELIKVAQGRAALEVDAKNLRELNKHLTKSLIAIDSMLRDAGIHGSRVEEEHLSENSQLIAIDVAEAISQMKDLSSHLKSLKALKIEPVPMVGAAWDALRHAGVNTNNHTTLADAIGWLGQRYEDVCREANRLVAEMNSETRNEFVNGVLTVHTEGATVIIVDHNT